jgi:hypothetical protein
VQPGIFPGAIKEPRVSPVEVTGDALAVEGELDAEFSLDGQSFQHSFCVCALPTEAYGILGADFLGKYDGQLDFGKRELRLKLPSLNRRTHKPIDKLAFTVFVKSLNTSSSDKSSKKMVIVIDGRSGRNKPMPHGSVPRETEPGKLRKDIDEYVGGCDAYQMRKQGHEYRAARENSRKAHASNKKYYYRKATDRQISIGDVVYVYSPAKKAKGPKKFWHPWGGPFRVVEKLKNKLDYRIVSPEGKESIVHVNRRKRAFNHNLWNDKGKGQIKYRINHRTQKEQEEEGVDEMLSPGPIMTPEPRVANPCNQGTVKSSGSKKRGNRTRK